VTSPDTGVMRILYDVAGNPVTKIENSAGSPSRSASRSYDGLDRLTLGNLPNDPDWVFTYDTDSSKNQKGRLAQASNGIVTSAYSYTDRGQVSLERTTMDGLLFDTTTTYDAAGQVATLTSPGGISTTTQYAGARPKRVDVTAGSATQSIENLAFYPFGPRARAELPPYDAAAPAGNKVISTRSYNLRGQVSEIDVTGPSSLVALDRSYTYDFTSGAPGPNDPGPNLDRVIDHRDGSESRFYFYDELDRLWKASDLSGAALFTYGYDAAGNRTSQSSASGATAYTYVSGTDRLASSTGASAQSYQHDAFGSRTYAGATAYAGIPTYVYDDANRLATLQSATPPPVTLTQYRYDAFGRRVAKILPTGAVYFFYDAAGQILAEATPRSGDTDLVRRYVFVEGELLGIVDRYDQNAGTPAWVPGLLSEIPQSLRPSPQLVLALAAALGAALLLPVPVRRRLVAAGLAATAVLSLGSAGDPPTGFRWVHTDVLGTPLAVTDSPTLPTLPKVIWRAKHEPFGQATVDADPDGDGTSFSLHVRFPGQYYDAETGLHYNFYRTYDPVTGRYLEADPIGQAGGSTPIATR